MVLLLLVQKVTIFGQFCAKRKDSAILTEKVISGSKCATLLIKLSTGMNHNSGNLEVHKLTRKSDEK